MKMGELRMRPDDGGFVMQTPTGLRDVTLRCTHDGHVMVEEVTGGGVSITPLRITSTERIDTSPLANHLRAHMRDRQRGTNPSA